MSFKGTPMMLKFLNISKIEEFIRTREFATKPQIAAETNISLVTVTKLINELVKDEKIIPCGIDESTGGRRAKRYKINPESHYFVGLYYVKGTFIGIVADAIGKIKIQRKFPVQMSDAESIFEQTCEAIDNLMKPYNPDKLVVIGIGIPGVENQGVLNSISSLPAWEGFPLSARLKSRYGIPVLLENDINLAAIGLYSSQYEEEIHDMILIYLDEGVGAGIIINGALFRGKTNFAGELGYLPVGMQDSTDSLLSTKRERVETTIANIHKQIQEDSSEELKKVLHNVLEQILISVISVLNPEVIAVKSALLNDEGIAQIKELVSTTVGISNTPEFTLLSDIEECSLNGVVKMCMDYTDYNLRISSSREMI